MKKMKFSRDGKTLEVSDPAHIDCLKAKGWTCPELEGKNADDEKGKKQ